MNTRVGIAAGLAVLAIGTLASPRQASAAVFGKPAVAHAAVRDNDGRRYDGDRYQNNGRDGNRYDNDRRDRDDDWRGRDDDRRWDRDRDRDGRYGYYPGWDRRDRRHDDRRYRDAHREWDNYGGDPCPPAHHSDHHFSILGIRF